MRTKLTAATVILVAAAVGVGAYYSRRTLDEQARADAAARRADGHANMASRSQLVVRNLGSSAGVLLAGSDYSALKQLADQTLDENPNIEWIVISDEQGAASQVVVATEGAPAAVGDRIEDGLYDRLVDLSGREVLRLDSDTDPTLFTFGANIIVAAGERKRVVGQIRLSHSTKVLEEALSAALAEAKQNARASARKQLIVAGVILVIGILFAGYQGARISRPIRELNKTAGAIAAGDFERRVQIGSRDEIGQLAKSFNSMAESLGSLLEEMAAKASLERELELARSVQQLMSPPSDPVNAGPFSLAGHCQLADDCGGDWWSYRRLADDSLLLVVGDVTGHGMPAAMIAATARGAVEALAMDRDAALEPSVILEAIDCAIRDVGKEQLLMTCFALLVQPDKGIVRFANAGHCFPYVLRPDQQGRLGKPGVLAVRGNPLGNPRKIINVGERAFGPGDVLVLTTDGLFDRISGSGVRFGEKRLRKIMTGHEMGTSGSGVIVLRDEIVEQVAEFGASAPADDDMTLVVCQYTRSDSAEKSFEERAKGAA